MEPPCESYKIKEDVVKDGKLYEKVTSVHSRFSQKIIEPTLFSVASKVPLKWEGYHAINDNQKAVHGFKIRSIHKMRITQNDGSYSYYFVKIIKECEYNSAKDVFGSYNATDSFNGQRFTRALELEFLA